MNIPFYSPTLRFGIGCFETIKVYPTSHNASAHIMFLPEHLKRLRRGGDLLGIQINDIQQAEEEITEFVKQQHPNTIQTLRLILTAESGLRYFLEDYKENTNAVSLTINECYLLNSKSPLSNIKSFHYLDKHLAWLDAKKHGFDDALLLNESGFLGETSRANIFFFDGKCWYTPPISTGILAGIIRQNLIKILDAKETNIVVADLDKFDHAIICNSLIEVSNVKSIDTMSYILQSEQRLAEIKERLESEAKR